MDIEVVVEIPKGSRNKYEADHDTGEIWLDRHLFTATVYPTDYGFVPHTLAEDGDPRWADINDLADLAVRRPMLVEEIEHFFDVYKMLEPGKDTQTRGWEGAEAGAVEVEAARRRYTRGHDPD